MAAEVEPLGTEGQDYIVVEKEDRKIVVPIRKSKDEKYHSDPQIRALQMVHEGRIGGAGRGQGRKRKPRAAEQVAEEVRKRAHKIVSAIDAGLDSESVKEKMAAADMALRIEREEAKLQLEEHKTDDDTASKEELLATLIQLVSDPSTEAALEAVWDAEGSAVEEVSSQDILEAEAFLTGSVESEDAEGTSDPEDPPEDGPDARPHRRNGRRRNARGRAKRPSPFTPASD